MANVWVSVVFFQGEEAWELIDQWDATSTMDILPTLDAYDYGDETTGAALIDGHVYRSVQLNPGEQVEYPGDTTAIRWNGRIGYVEYLRRVDIPDTELDYYGIK